MSTLAERLRALSPAKRALLAKKLGATAGADSGPSIPTLPREARGYPLSFAQERMWFLQRAHPESGAYNLGLSFRAPFDPDRIQAAINRVIARHEAWRVTFHLEEGVVEQRIQAHQDIEIPRLRPEPGLSEEAHRAREGARMMGAPFDLEAGPLWRFAILEGSEPGIYTFIVVLHHIIFDSFSVQVLLSEVILLHQALAAGDRQYLQPLPIQYIDYAAWERREGQKRWEAQLGVWKARLKGAPSCLEIAADRPRPPHRSGEGGAVTLRIDPELTAGLKALGAEAGATLYNVLLAAFKVLLYRHSGQPDLVVGAPVAARSQPEVRNLLGLFVNTVPLRTDLSGAPTFRDLLGRVSEVTREALGNADVPFGVVCDAVGVARSSAYHPLFQVLFDLHVGLKLPEGVPWAPDSIGQLVPEGSAKFDLSLVLSEEAAEGAETPGLTGRLEYSVDLFEAGTAQAMAEQLGALLKAVVADPDRPIGRLPLMDQATRREILDARGLSPFPLPAAGAYAPTLPAQVEAMARRAPEALAITLGSAEAGTLVPLTYGALEARANQVAHALKALGAGRDRLVALCMDRSPDLIVGMLGILKAGAAYLPLEPAWPLERMRYVLADAKAEIVVTHSELAALFADSAPAVVALDRCEAPAEGPRIVDSAALSALPESPPEGGPAPEDLAYCIYTSGSTGAPKGVLVTHHNAMRLFSASADLFDYGPGDVWSLFHSVAFDFSVWEIWGALLHGGRLVIVPYGVSRSPQAFVSLLAEAGVTHLSQTPSALATLARADAEAGGPPLPLRCVVLGGEAFEPRRYEAFLRRYEGQARIINMYGITETTVHVTYRPVTAMDAARGFSPIGAPLPDLRIYLLDEAMEPVPTGAPGELWVGGEGVTRGYLDRPELSAARFLQSPFGPGRLYRSGDLARYRADGELQYLGRNDHQVKVRGFRIEIGEIEAALRTHPDVEDAAVVLRKDEISDMLVAYVVTGAAAVDPSALRQHLQRTLPDYFLPGAFVCIEALPLTVNGKLDRGALPAAEAGRAPEARYVAPEGPLQEALAELWARVLGIDKVGAQDNFFALGGDSIKGAIMIESLQRRMKVIIHVVVLFDVQTVADLAAWLAHTHPEAVQRLSDPEAGGAEATERALTAGADITEEALARFKGLVPAMVPRSPEERCPRAIFVLTPPRSGSTLLRVILGGHAALFSPPELELLPFGTLAERAEAFSGRMKLWKEGTVRALMALMGLDADAAFAEMTRLEASGMDVPGFYAHLQGLMGDRILVDKTASYPLSLDVLAAAERYFEDPLYIHLHRHPIDGVLSFLAAGIDQLGLVRAEHDFSREQLSELVYTLSHRNILSFLEGVPQERQMRLVYEDLVTDPVEQIGRLCAFIGVEPAEAMLDPYTDREHRMTDGVRKDAGWTLGDIKFHHYKRIEASSARRWQKAGAQDNLGGPTWAVAEALGYARPEPLSPLLVPLRQGAEVHPLFLVHPVGGHVFCYRPLAQRLGGDRPIYGIQAEAFAGVEDRADTLEGIAARYVEAIRTAQPEGPYALGGWSLGGVIAFEMARQLRGEGEDVAALVLIDSPVPGEREVGGLDALLAEADDPLEAYMGMDLAALGGAELPEMIEAMRHLGPEARQAYIRERVGRNKPLAHLGEAQRARLGEVFKTHRAALAAYRPERYEGAAVLVKAARQLSGPGAGPGWAPLVGALAATRVPGHHYSMMQPPYVDDLARHIEPHLTPRTDGDPEA